MSLKNKVIWLIIVTMLIVAFIWASVKNTNHQVEYFPYAPFDYGYNVIGENVILNLRDVDEISVVDFSPYDIFFDLAGDINRQADIVNNVRNLISYSNSQKHNDKMTLIIPDVAGSCEISQADYYDSEIFTVIYMWRQKESCLKDCFVVAFENQVLYIECIYNDGLLKKKYNIKGYKGTIYE